ncbi:hypothetical protein HMPREF9303_2300 [Prevotella denticola CRIS 18C-A]|uniref:Uncharacterized protein n=1 Tax=Prevotella denticola CRIS 18C-A TaxID=944557 RepID=F0H3W4_9BACT|nr:hypothetical protein HMPREF9303_2300 [Prevotella denticola CRIS 18C-A]
MEINLSTGCIDFLFFLVYKVSSGNPQDCLGKPVIHFPVYIQTIYWH